MVTVRGVLLLLVGGVSTLTGLVVLFLGTDSQSSNDATCTSDPVVTSHYEVAGERFSDEILSFRELDCRLGRGLLQPNQAGVGWVLSEEMDSGGLISFDSSSIDESSQRVCDVPFVGMRGGKERILDEVSTRSRRPTLKQQVLMFTANGAEDYVRAVRVSCTKIADEDDATRGTSDYYEPPRPFRFADLGDESVALREQVSDITQYTVLIRRGAAITILYYTGIGLSEDRLIEASDQADKVLSQIHRSLQDPSPAEPQSDQPSQDAELSAIATEGLLTLDELEAGWVESSTNLQRPTKLCDEDPEPPDTFAEPVASAQALFLRRTEAITQWNSIFQDEAVAAETFSEVSRLLAEERECTRTEAEWTDDETPGEVRYRVTTEPFVIDAFGDETIATRVKFFPRAWERPVRVFDYVYVRRGQFVMAIVVARYTSLNPAPADEVLNKETYETVRLADLATQDVSAAIDSVAGQDD